MIERKAVVGLTLLSALLFCAFAAQSASAVEKESANTTAFTCVQDAVNKNGDFTDPHCDKAGTAGKSEYRHDLITGSTKIGGTNEGTTEETKKLESVILRGNIGLTKTETTCEKYTVDETRSFIENSEPKLKDHKLKGTVVANLSKCTVKSPAKCTTREPIETVATFVGVDGLTGPKGEENAMGVRFTGEFETEGKKETFAKIRYEGAECAQKEKEYPVAGSAIGTAGPTTESGQANKGSGATLVFTPKFSTQKLYIGTEANKAEFETIATPRMAEKGNPIPLTTVT